MTADSLAPHCHGFGCTSTDLIKAHLVPQSFGRLIKSPKGPNTRVSERRSTTKAQHGLFDPHILCEGCDGYLNKRYDNPAFSLINKLKFRPDELDLGRSHFENPNIDGDLLCSFILSVLWRCAISKLYEASNVSLGPYVNAARDVLWGIRSLESFTHYRVMVQRYHEAPGVEKMYSLPMPVEFNVGQAAWKGFLFVLVGFRFMVTLDPRPLPTEYDSYVLNGNETLRGSLVHYPETYEARITRDLLALPPRARRLASLSMDRLRR
jgi:hypothetical protein